MVMWSSPGIMLSPNPSVLSSHVANTKDNMATSVIRK
jgi:hypothetical protein